MIALASVLLVLAAAPAASAPARPAASSAASTRDTSATATDLAASAQSPAPSPAPPAPPHRPQRPAIDAAQRSIIGDVAGGRFVPPQILTILADRHFDPDVAFILWQLSRRELDDWTISELALVAQVAPTEVEAGVPIVELQTLYKFWGLDPSDVFNPSLGPNWQSQSTAYSPDSAARVGAISTAECQVGISQMTLGTYRSCLGAAQ
jgi:hypothetical protein